jgi:hypothetical protein
MTKQSKRARFARKAKLRRLVAHIHKVNHNRPGFIGVVTCMNVAGVRLGPGAVFLAAPRSAKP